MGKNRALFIVVLLLLVLSIPVQAQEFDLAQSGSVTISYSDGSRVMCVTSPMAGWSGGMYIPGPDSQSPSSWAACNVAYTLEGVSTISFSPVGSATSYELVCDEGFVPESPEGKCRVNPSLA